MEMSKYHAYVKLPLHFVILNDNGIGYRVTQKAIKSIIEDLDFYSVKLNDEIIWVSNEEFEENNLTEFEIPNNCIFREPPLNYYSTIHYQLKQKYLSEYKPNKIIFKNMKS